MDHIHDLHLQAKRNVMNTIVLVGDWRKRMRSYLEGALRDMKQLEDEIRGASAGTVLITTGWFIRQKLGDVIMNLETAVTLLETKNDHGGNRDHSGT